MKVKLVFYFQIVFFIVCLSVCTTACRQKNKTIAEKVIVTQPEELAPTTSEIIRATLEESNDNTELDSFSLKNMALLNEWYGQKSYASIWTESGKWLPHGDSLLVLISTARSHGLFPEHYNYTRLTDLHKRTADTTKNQALDASLWAQTDLLLSSAFIQFVKDLKKGRLTADSVLQQDSSLSVHFFDRQMQLFVTEGNQKFVAALEPKHLRYHQLKNALQQFLSDADLKRYTYVNGKDTANLRAAVAQRLQEEEQASSIGSDSTTLATAIKKYQVQKGLKPDGKIGPLLIDELNNTDNEKFTQVAITLDRFKILPALPEEYIWVNIPAYRLDLMQQDMPVLTSRVVVGKSYTRTPVLTSAISDMITYPQWHIPNSIIKKDILPALKKDPGYLARKGYSLSDWKGNIIDPYTIDWNKYKEGIPYRVIQGSGDDNALGILKFNFPNKYSVYLHDTNQRYLFSREKRALSHGCVRVEMWDELAYFLLERDGSAANATPVDSLKTWLALKEKHVVPLRKRMPLYIRYFTCEANEEGGITFYEDVYGDDRNLKEKFFGKTKSL